MSKQGTDLVKHVFEAINRGDVDAALEVADQDFEMDWSNSNGPFKGVYRGVEEVRGVWTSFIDAFDSLKWNAAETVDLGDGRLIVVNRVQMRGRGSGAEVQAIGVQLWTIEGETARSVKLYQSKDEALSDLGVSR